MKDPGEKPIDHINLTLTLITPNNSIDSVTDGGSTSRGSQFGLPLRPSGGSTEQVNYVAIGGFPGLLLLVLTVTVLIP